MNIRTTKPAPTGRHATVRRVASPAASELPATVGGLAFDQDRLALTAPADPVTSARLPRPSRRALATTVGVTTGALVVLAEAGSAFAGMNLGNHNESLLLPPDEPPTQQIRGRRGRLARSALAVAAALAVTVGFVNDGTSNTHHEAAPGNYGSSSGGGSASR